MPSTPEYEEDVYRGYNKGLQGEHNKQITHKVLYALRKSIGVFARDGIMRVFMDQAKQVLNHPGFDKSKFHYRQLLREGEEERSWLNKEELSAVSREYTEFLNAWDTLEGVFGDLEDNRRHPAFWDNLRFVFSGKVTESDSDEERATRSTEKRDSDGNPKVPVAKRHGIVGKDWGKE